MIRYTRGNLLEADVEALVNTVNTVGVMGKGIALQFKDKFRENFAAYSDAWKRGELQIGRMFVTKAALLTGQRWIINFPTKKHWRQASKLEYIEEGLKDLVRVIRELGIRSIALPPLGCGQGGLDWPSVRRAIETAFEALPEVDAIVFEPTAHYQATPKGSGAEDLTVARAIVVDLIRKYLVLGLDCTNLEVHKLTYVMQRVVVGMNLPDVMKLRFQPHIYGPYADNLRHLVDRLDGSYLRLEKRAADIKALDPVALDARRLPKVEQFLTQADAAPYVPALARVDEIIDGFQSPYLMELLATVDWIMREHRGEADTETILEGLRCWPGDPSAGARKVRLFDVGSVEITRERLAAHAHILYPESDEPLSVQPSRT